MIHTVVVYPETYVDSVVQLFGSRALLDVDGVDWASSAMATPGNVAILEKEGFDIGPLADAGANDLFIAVRAESSTAVDAARAAGEKALFAAQEQATISPPRKTLMRGPKRSMSQPSIGTSQVCISTKKDRIPRAMP